MLADLRLAGAEKGDVLGGLITDDQTIKFPVGRRKGGGGRVFTSAMPSHHQTSGGGSGV